MYQLLKDSSHSGFALPFIWMANEIELLKAAGFQNIQVHALQCMVYPAMFSVVSYV